MQENCHLQMKINYIKRTPKTSASGKDYISVSIKVEEYGEQYLSGFGSDINENWQVGDDVDLDITTKEKDGKEYLNFTAKTSSVSKPNPPAIQSNVTNEQLMIEIKFIREAVKRLLEKETKGYVYPTPEDVGIDEGRPSGEPLDNF